MAAYKKMKTILLTCALLLCGAASQAGETPGHLVIIGGGDGTDLIMSRFIELAGGKESRIVIIPLASEAPLEAAKDQEEELKQLGAGSADWVIFPKGGADTEENLAKFSGATGVFFTGGDQVRLVSFLAGTRLLEEVRRIYRKGGVVGGTSAGAAVMSKVMITGEDLLEVDDEAFTGIRAGSVVTAEGFGFVPADIVVDQHFLMRKRHNRLLSVVLENPGLTGIGIDESTALIVGPDGVGEVMGNSLVAVYDVSGAGPVTRDAKGHLAAEGITLHLLKSGDRYNLKKARTGTKK